MYNSSEMTADEELTFLSFNQTINKEFTVGDILDSPLWITDNSNGIIKAIPLFNCDKITSSNENDKILDDNKCVILENDEDTLIECISNDTGSIHYYDVYLHAFAPYPNIGTVDEITIYCVVFDEFLNHLNNTKIEVYIDNVLTDIVVTNHQGVCKYNIDRVCNIQFKYNAEINRNYVIG